jgi:hypothetical protein
LPEANEPGLRIEEEKGKTKKPTLDRPLSYLKSNANVPLEKLDVMDSMMRNLETVDPKAYPSRMDEVEMRQRG